MNYPDLIDEEVKKVLKQENGREKLSEALRDLRNGKGDGRFTIPKQQPKKN